MASTRRNMQGIKAELCELWCPLPNAAHQVSCLHSNWNCKLENPQIGNEKKSIRRGSRYRWPGRQTVRRLRWMVVRIRAVETYFKNVDFLDILGFLIFKSKFLLSPVKLCWIIWINWSCYNFVTLNIAVKTFMYRPSSWSHSCVQCTACDFAYIQT